MRFRRHFLCWSAALGRFGRIALSATALATALSEQSAGAGLPALLTLSAVKGAVHFAAGTSAAVGGLSSQVITLAENAMTGIVGLKVKMFAVLLASGVVAGGVG